MKKLIVLLTVAISGNLYSQENAVVPEIKSVTVYTSAAEIHYQKSVSLNKGRNTIIFEDLTPFVVSNSLNVKVSDIDIDIESITERINYLKDNKATDKKISALRDSLLKIENDLGMMRALDESLIKEKGILFKDESIGGLASGVAVEEIQKASAFFHTRYTYLNEEIFLNAKKKKDLKLRAAKYKEQLAQMENVTSKNVSEIDVVVLCPSKRTVTFDFQLLTSRAGWAPIYDVKYQGPGQPINFKFRANIFNASGFAWNNVDIVLSTANPIMGFKVPSLSDGTSTNVKDSVVDGIVFKNIAVVNGIAEYNIDNKYSIPANAKPYLIDVDKHDLPASFHYLIIPKLDNYGFLMAAIPDWSKNNLIPGRANIYNMGSYMGKTFLNTYAENDTLSIFLGKDKSIYTQIEVEEKHHQRLVIGNNIVEKTDVTITIKNNTSSNLKVQVIDQVPLVSLSKELKFDLNHVDDAEYVKSEGKLTWEIEAQPQISSKIKFDYSFKVPKNVYARVYKTKSKAFRLVSCPSF